MSNLGVVGLMHRWIDKHDSTICGLTETDDINCSFISADAIRMGLSHSEITCPVCAKGDYWILKGYSSYEARDAARAYGESLKAVQP